MCGDPRELNVLPHAFPNRRAAVLSHLRTLQGRQAATTFSHVWGPPLARGTTWSMESAESPQYWHRPPSRAKTARRFRAARRAKGTLTKWRRRRSEEHTSELQSLMRSSYAVFCLTQKNNSTH